MATLFKLAITAQTTATVTTQPEVENFFYTVDPLHISAGVLTIPATAFVDDSDSPVTDITVITPNNGFYLLFINGVLQQDSLYTVTASEVVISDASTIQTGVPVTLVVANFDPDVTANVTINT